MPLTAFVLAFSLRALYKAGRHFVESLQRDASTSLLHGIRSPRPPVCYLASRVYRALWPFDAHKSISVSVHIQLEHMHRVILQGCGHLTICLPATYSCLQAAHAAEHDARESIRASVRTQLEYKYQVTLKGRGNLRKFLRDIHFPVAALPPNNYPRKRASEATAVSAARETARTAESAALLAKALKQAKVHYHPDKARGDLTVRVRAEEISKILNSWDCTEK